MGGGGMDSSWRASTELSGESRINSALSNGHNGGETKSRMHYLTQPRMQM